MANVGASVCGECSLWRRCAEKAEVRLSPDRAGEYPYLCQLRIVPASIGTYVTQP